mgnify:FL=1
MAENNVIYTVVTPDVPKAIPGEQLYVYVPQASFTNPGIAKFNKEEFTISADGLVSLVAQFIREEELNKDQFAISDNGEVSIKDKYVTDTMQRTVDALNTEIGKANKTASDAKAIAGRAESTANVALNTANGIDSKASDALTAARIAETYATQAQKDAASAVQIATQAVEQVGDKLDATAVVQETGIAEDKVISQKVVTEKLNEKLDKQSTETTVYAIDNNGNQYQLAYNSTTDESLITLGQLVAKLLGYLLTSGGTITNDLAIQGNLTVRGTTTTTIEETLNVKDAIVVANADAADLSATLAGFVIRVHAEDCYGILYDFSSNSIKLGLGQIADGKFVFYEGEGNAVAVRSDGSLMTNGHLVKWDATALKFVDAGKSVDNFVLRRNKTGDYAYGIVSGYEGTWPISTTPKSLAIPHYDSRTLNLKTSTPSADLDCVNKQYFESKTAVLIDNSLLGG